jgi:hypothetical protein
LPAKLFTVKQQAAAIHGNCLGDENGDGHLAITEMQTITNNYIQSCQKN